MVRLDDLSFPKWHELVFVIAIAEGVCVGEDYIRTCLEDVHAGYCARHARTLMPQRVASEAPVRHSAFTIITQRLPIDFEASAQG